MKKILVIVVISLLPVHFNTHNAYGINADHFNLGFEQQTSFGDKFLGLERPCDGYVSRKFDPEVGHYGIDYALKEGSPVFAAENGYVLFSDFTVDYGNTIIIIHNGGFVTMYKHCRLLIKSEREKVVQGDMIALSGNTGRLTTGPHLHFEVWKNGTAVDPERYLVIN